MSPSLKVSPPSMSLSLLCERTMRPSSRTKTPLTSVEVVKSPHADSGSSTLAVPVAGSYSTRSPSPKLAPPIAPLKRVESTIAPFARTWAALRSMLFLASS